MSKLKSRKFWMAIVAAAVLVLNDGLGMHLDKETIMTLAGVVISYILGQSYVDANKEE